MGMTISEEGATSTPVVTTPPPEPAPVYVPPASYYDLINYVPIPPSPVYVPPSAPVPESVPLTKAQMADTEPVVIVPPPPETVTPPAVVGTQGGHEVDIDDPISPVSPPPEPEPVVVTPPAQPVSTEPVIPPLISEGQRALYDLIASGQAPAGSTLIDYDPTSGIVRYNVPPTGRQGGHEASIDGGEPALQSLIDEGLVPQGAELIDYNETTGEVTYQPPVTGRTGGHEAVDGIAALQELVDAGVAPEGSTLADYNEATGRVQYYSPSPGTPGTQGGHEVAEEYVQAPTIVPVGFVGPIMPDQVRAENVWSEIVKKNPELRSSELVSYDASTGQFNYNYKENPSIGPANPENKKVGWVGEKVMKLEQWQAGLLGDLDSSYSKTTNTAAKLGLTALGGLFTLGLTTVTGIPILAGKIIADPAKGPATVLDVGKGMVTHVGATAYNILSNKYTKDIMSGDLSKMVFDMGMTYMVVSGAAKGAKAVTSTVVTYLHPRGVNAGSLVKEVSTGRTPVTMKELSKQYAEAQNKVEILVTKKGGPWKGDVPVKGTPYSMRYIKTPVEKTIGNALFSGTKDVVDASGKITTESLLRIAEREGKIVSGEVSKTNPKGALLYTDPWAAIGYSRGGTNPGLLMVITDASKIKSGAKGLEKGLTESESFIRGSKPGFYGSSKSWSGDLETEIVGAPGTKVVVPPPKADLITRALAGKYSDMFTYDSGNFVPIKVGLDVKNFSRETLNSVNNPATWYAVKLNSLIGSVVTTAEALKHPGLILKDLSGITKEMFNIDRFLREGTGSKGTAAMPGVRDIYLVQSLGSRLQAIKNALINYAKGKTRNKLGNKVKEDSEIFRREFERNLEESYRVSASNLLNAFKNVSAAYASSSSVRRKFEDAYLNELSTSAEAAVKSARSESITRDIISRDVKSRPVTETARKAVSEFAERVREKSDVPQVSTEIRSTGSSEVTGSEPSTGRTESSGASESPASGRTEESPSTESEVIETRTPDSGRSDESGSTQSSGSTESGSTRSAGSTESGGRTESARSGESAREIRSIQSRTGSHSDYSESSGGEIAPPVIIPEVVSGGVPRAQVPNGSIAWRQGMFWQVITPPYNMDKPITLRKGVLPLGAKRTDGRTPEETVQMIGTAGANVPQRISVDKGVTDIFIEDGGQRIIFGGGGDRTNVGTRIDSNLTGLSIEEDGEPILSERRPVAVAKPVVKKKAHRHTDRSGFADLLSLRNMKY